MNRNPACVQQLLQDQAELRPDAIAFLAPGRAPLTYGRCLRHVEEMVQMLYGLGLGRQDRVALVLPNGAEMAVAFLVVTAGAACAPLNPAYSAEEFDFYLKALRPKALMIEQGMDSPARALAQARDIRVLELSCMLEAEAGLFKLTNGGRMHSLSHGFAAPDDVALVLPTSGTTSRPKIVPLTHANICTAAHNLRTALALVESDRCLNMAPLFHTYGLVASTLTSMAAGASMVCLPGFATHQFFAWLAEFRPTWYQAVPAMHHAILVNAAGHDETIVRCPLRFIRTGTAPLSPPVRAKLERVFNTCVVEVYGTVEASGPVTCNPPPSRQRKAGSVGTAIGPEVAIMDEVGSLLPAGEIGEVVVRGATVMQGYDNDPTANRSVFTHGWFRTGDRGFLDADGYLFITGRLKEIINRGGEKISPCEVEEVLMAHPAVAEVAAFAIPHAQLGEDVAVAIVLRENTSATDRDIREFAGTRLAGFKVPRQVVFVDEIPTGATGKVQRLGLAERLGLLAPGCTQPQVKTDFAGPRTPIEAKLARIWAQVLGLERVGIRDDFFELGGDSLQAVSLFVQIEKIFGKELPLAVLLQAPTVEHLASILRQEAWSEPWSSLVPLQPDGPRPPFFCIHGPGGHVLSYYDLARHLRPAQPVYGLQAQGLDGKHAPLMSIEDMAAHYIKEIHSLQPDGPYFLGGLCFGGILAFEMAQQLHAQGQKVALLALFDAYNKRNFPFLANTISPIPKIAQLARKINFHVNEVFSLNNKEKISYLRIRIKYAIHIIKEVIW
jgi:acyl-CoA synthetase (AMP-forming)/AMP-acid ligase II/acyl carrier protein